MRPWLNFLLLMPLFSPPPVLRAPPLQQGQQTAAVNLSFPANRFAPARAQFPLSCQMDKLFSMNSWVKNITGLVPSLVCSNGILLAYPTFHIIVRSQQWRGCPQCKIHAISQVVVLALLASTILVVCYSWCGYRHKIKKHGQPVLPHVVAKTKFAMMTVMTMFNDGRQTQDGHNNNSKSKRACFNACFKIRTGTGCAAMWCTVSGDP